VRGWGFPFGSCWVLVGGLVGLASLQAPFANPKKVRVCLSYAGVAKGETDRAGRVLGTS
jgi:hypothetical protein